MPESILATLQVVKFLYTFNQRRLLDNLLIFSSGSATTRQLATTSEN